MTARKFIRVGTAAETTITVHRESYRQEPAQGLVLEADHPLSVNDCSAHRIVLWADTAPETTEVVTSDAGELRVWNVWRDGDLVQAWEGNAEMIVDDEGDDLGLLCHDGTASAEASLSVRLLFDRAWTQPAD